MMRTGGPGPGVQLTVEFDESEDGRAVRVYLPAVGPRLVAVVTPHAPAGMAILRQGERRAAAVVPLRAGVQFSVADTQRADRVGLVGRPNVNPVVFALEPIDSAGVARRGFPGRGVEVPVEDAQGPHVTAVTGAAEVLSGADGRGGVDAEA